MNGILNKPEPQPHDPSRYPVLWPSWFLVDRVGLDDALDLLTCLLEAL
jgi:hypothetical protein